MNTPCPPMCVSVVMCVFLFHSRHTVKLDHWRQLSIATLHLLCHVVPDSHTSVQTHKHTWTRDRLPWHPDSLLTNDSPLLCTLWTNTFPSSQPFIRRLATLASVIDLCTIVFLSWNAGWSSVPENLRTQSLHPHFIFLWHITGSSPPGSMYI